ncbi:MAG: sulfatase [Planctomycetota bacterium]
MPNPFSCQTLGWVLCLAALIVEVNVDRCDAQDKPNIIVITLDDADAELFELPYSSTLFPNIIKLADDGIRFNNFHVTTPLCGPSRACFYRAQYAHNTGIRVNQPRQRNANGYQGGFRYYREQGYFENDLSVWMKDAGYRTMMVGKFLHSDFERYVPPSWDDFRSYLGGRYFGTYVFSNRDHAGGKVAQNPVDLYRTVSETNDAVELMSEHVAASVDQPFFLNVNPLGPHRGQTSHPEMIEPRMQNWWTRILQPHSRAYNESDVSDKGGFFRGLPLLPLGTTIANEIHYRERALATRSVDDMVGAIRAKTVELGIADNTYIFVTSDNGFLLGHHRAYGKGVAADRVSRVPCYVIGPDVPANQVSNHLVAHIDLGPTITQLAGGTVPQFVDGRSFAGLLQPDGILNTPQHRLGMLIENFASLNMFGQSTLNGAAMTVRFKSEIYTEWSNGDREYYDLSTDPEQLENRYDTLPESQQRLYAAWLRVLNNPEREPQVTYAAPLVDGGEAVVGGSIYGVADDWDGVREVKLAIRDVGNRKYWNGSAWQDSFVQVSASLSNRNGQLAQWHFDQMPNDSLAGSDRFVVWGWAFDTVGNYTAPNRISFRYDRTRPVVSVVTEAETEFDGQVEISGTAEDEVGATVVRVLIRNRENNLYWTADGFVVGPAQTELPVNGSGNWSWTEEMPKGSYEMSAVAFDGSANQSNPAIFRFSVK